MVKVILNSDDSDGMIGDVAQELLDLHHRACDSGVADPVKLARWMVRFEFDDQDFFLPDPVRYATALGEPGLAIFRREVERRLATGDDSFAVRYVTERLAILDGDVDAVIRLFGGGLSRPYDFIHLAEAMEELGRDDDVLIWTERGIAEMDGWQVGQLYDLAAAAYSRRHDPWALFELRRSQHNRVPSASSYGHLQEAAKEVGVWESERSAARSVMAEGDRGGLVDVLLTDGEPDAAWQEATTSPEWDVGERRWIRLAEARQLSHPEDAMEVYLQLADRELETANRSAYMRAIRMLKRAARAAAMSDRTTEFTEYLHLLRDRYRRRPTLIAMLDKAGFV